MNAAEDALLAAIFIGVWLGVAALLRWWQKERP